MGPLKGFRILEIAGIGPSQFCGMLLADMGASIIRIDRPAGANPGTGISTGRPVLIPDKFNLMNRSRPTIAADLKSEQGRNLVFQLCKHADAIFEGFRPGVMEKLGLGPDDCRAVNARLVYGRMTGWGQEGPLADTAGHDGNYAAISGALGAIGEKGKSPAIPLNLVADFGGGGAYLAIGILAALLEAQRSGSGQVVDAAMVDGSASLMTLFYGLYAGGLWKDERGSNLLDGAAPFYRPYRTSDGRHVVVCAIEPQFFAELLQVANVQGIDPSQQHDQSKWREHIDIFNGVFASRTRDQWAELFSGTDACVTPILSLSETPDHVHIAARNTFVTVDGIRQPAPAPRFSRTRSGLQSGPQKSTCLDADMLRDWGLSQSDIGNLTENNS
jgi:alpha-methylacyl-CoA racemase